MYPDGRVGMAIFGNDAESPPNEQPPPGMTGSGVLHLARLELGSDSGLLVDTCVQLLLSRPRRVLV